MKPHKHKDLIIAWANGSEIEYKNFRGNWNDATSPDWSEEIEYRIKSKRMKSNKTFDIHFRCHTDEIGKITKVEVLND